MNRYPKKKIALVAHDPMKPDLLEWAKWNKAPVEDKMDEMEGK